MNIKKLTAIILIFACTASAWFVLGNALDNRTRNTHEDLLGEVQGNWGSPIVQPHPTLYYIAPTSARAKRVIQPNSSTVDVDLQYDPKKKGLLWYRTYVVDFGAEYVVRNPTPIRQTVFVVFNFPKYGMRYDKFALKIGEKLTDKVPSNGSIAESVLLHPNAETTIRIGYRAAAMGHWEYSLADTPRVQNFALNMNTDFTEVNIPAGTESPTAREATTAGWNFIWEYADVIGANAIGMEMPAALNPGPVAARIIFFAPISLLFFFAVVVILSIVLKTDLHPMNYFFLGAGCFAFQLLFAYLLDLIGVHIAFAFAATVSLSLVTGYLWLVAGRRFALSSGAAQFFYMVLFSYSFFFNGLTGITITVGSIITLAVLMVSTAKIDWNDAFNSPPSIRSESNPPPLPLT